MSEKDYKIRESHTSADNAYAQMDKNNVSAKNQLKNLDPVVFENVNGSGKRIMFVGNSITLHRESAAIGWYNECGMAATCKQNDYVHILMDKINKLSPDSRFCICQVAKWESEYKNGEEKHYLYEKAQDFEADIIIMRFVENCPKKDFDPAVFKNSMDKLLNFLNKSQKAKIVMTTGFWKHPGDSVIREYAKENNLPLAELGDLGELDEMKAVGLFEHRGVANHPGDLGMKNMAERIFEAMKNIL